MLIATGMEAGAAGSGCFGETPVEHEAIPIVNTKAIKVLSKTRRNKLFPFLFKDLSNFGLQRENKNPLFSVWAGWGGCHLNLAFPRRPRWWHLVVDRTCFLKPTVAGQCRISTDFLF